MVPLVLAGLHQVMPGWADHERARDHTATYKVSIRGYGRHVYDFTDGQLVIDPPHASSLDVRISARAAPWLLLSFGRIGKPQPVLTGALIAWGRRPWLAPNLNTLFHSA